MAATRDRADVSGGGGAVDESSLREEEVESRWEAAPAVLVIVGLQIVLAVVSMRGRWKLWELPWWIWLCSVPLELVLLVPLAFSRPRHQLEQLGMRRMVALGLLAVVSAGNAIVLVALVGSLLRGDEKSGPELLLKAVAVWSTNVTTFGLWYWGLDRGGPVLRRAPNPPSPDFQFPQLENPQLAAPGWHPRLLDYIYVSFTNSIAFSPTDAMPLVPWAKLTMALQSVISLVILGLVIARAVNVFS